LANFKIYRIDKELFETRQRIMYHWYETMEIAPIAWLFGSIE